MQAFGYFAGDFVIISGCQQTGTTIANGVIFINGEVLEFRGGNVAENVIIREESVSGTFEDGSFKPIEVTRYASFGTSTENYPWANFKRGFPTTEIPAMRDTLNASISVQNTRNDGQDTTIAALLTRIEALEKRKSFIPVGLVAIWNKTSDIPIPDGWKECTDLRGRMPLGWNPDEPEFNTIGNTGGEKAHQLTIDEMPQHNHSVSFGTERVGTGNGNGLSKNGSGSAWKNTENTGANLAHNNMPPYRVIKFIEYVG